ncbi:tfp pilus assembly protein PilW [Gynuella sunshinyii YC6258]|uniref:Tfp pilus assembly protein PilW n=2 Tax=Gynuella sunshinyii TaxID=1445505 RepID=A0A0C5VD10_9GAMM|nr:tfp pilus assembly protein PilW [Gynuella sunshinyii YC6258]
MTFVSTKGMYTTQQGLSQIQDTGRLAIEFLEKDIRMAGYMGCATRSTTMTITNTLNNPGDYKYAFQTAIQGYTAATLPTGTLTKTPVANTDILVVRSAGSSGVQVSKNNDSAQVFVTNTGTETGGCGGNKNRVSGICEGDILVVTDCSKARIFQVSNITQSGNEVNLVHSQSGGNSPGNAISSWGGNSIDPDESFDAGSEVMTVTTSVYFIATGASGRPSLWKSQNGVEFELLPGVEDLAITYGVDTDASQDFIPNSYQTAGSVVDWNRVVSTQISLLIASTENNVLPEAQSYTFDGATVKPTDRRLRRVFSSTVGIRSRLN